MLWLVTPVYGRVELTRICLEQRARMLEELDSLGVRARQLIVGDDENLDTARELGFTVLERPNEVGRRVNDGFEWAAREGGATHVAYCGSDDWHLASYFAAPVPHAVTTSYWQAFVHPTGNRLVVIRGTAAAGGAPWIIPTHMLEGCGYRPAREDAMRAVDSSIADGIGRVIERAQPTHRGRQNALRNAWHFDEGADRFRMVDFKGGDRQITPWERIVVRQRVLALDSRHPFVELARHYPADLVERMERFYATKGAR